MAILTEAGVQHVVDEARLGTGLDRHYHGGIGATIGCTTSAAFSAFQSSRRALKADIKERVMRSTLTVVVVATGLALVGTVVSFRQVAAEDESHGRGCSDATLRGEYAVVVSGVRAIGPTATEPFVAVGVRTFDGRGGFTDAASFHGAVLPAVRGGHVKGTYRVNADCTGTSSFQPPAPFPTIESDFVILDNGRTINEAVISPQSNVVTAAYRRR